MGSVMPSTNGVYCSYHFSIVVVTNTQRVKYCTKLEPLLSVVAPLLVTQSSVVCADSNHDVPFLKNTKLHLSLKDVLYLRLSVLYVEQ